VKARVGGALWLAVIVTGVLGQLLARSLLVPNNPGATAAGILRGESSFRVAFVATLISGMLYVGVTVILYEMLKRVSGTLAVVSAAFGMTGSIVSFATSVADLATLVLLKASYVSSSEAPQMQLLSLVSLGITRQGYILSMVFFGSQILIVGYLIARSTFLPRKLGALLMIGGFTYILGSLGTILSPELGAPLFRLSLLLALAGEGSLALWLLFKAVDVRQWSASHDVPIHVGLNDAV